MTSFSRNIYGVSFSYISYRTKPALLWAVLEKLGARPGENYILLHSETKTPQTQLKRQTKLVPV